MIYVGASPVIIQAMLGGQAGVGAGGGPPLGDQYSARRRHRRSRHHCALRDPIAYRETGDPHARETWRGKKIGISRLGAIPHFTLQAIVKLHNVQGVNIVQTGTTTQAITSLSQGLVDGIITSAPFTFRLMKDGYRELVSPKEFKKAGVEFLIQGLVARRSFAVKNREVVIGMIKATMEGTKQIVRQREASESRARQNTRAKPIRTSSIKPTSSPSTFSSKIRR